MTEVDQRLRPPGGDVLPDVPAGDGREVEQLRAVARTLAERVGQLEHALESRVLIEQAKGMLAERWAVTPDEAFGALRRAARNRRMRLRDLAAAVVAGRTTPDGLEPPGS